MSDDREPKFNPTQATFLSLVFAFACYFLLPHGWEVCGEAAMLLFGALLLTTSWIGRILAIALLLTAIATAHQFISSPNYSFFSLTGNPDTLVYIVEFLSSAAGAVAVVALDMFGFHNIRINFEYPIVWVLMYFFVLFLLVPTDITSMLAFGWSWPFVVTAYKCKSKVFRLISFGCVILCSVIIHRILSEHNRVLDQQFIMYGTPTIIFFA
jgi:hypothetical protein